MVEQQTVGISDVLLHLLVDASKFHYLRVRATILHRIATSNDVRRHVVREVTLTP